MGQVLLNRYKCLDYHILDLAHDSVRVLALLLETFQNFLQCALVPRIVIYVLRCSELVALLVDRVVGQVHEEVIEGILVGLCIEGLELVCGEPDQPLLVKEYFERLA